MKKDNTIDVNKTNAMRIVEAAGMCCEALFFDASDGRLDGKTAAARLGLNAEIVYKTLVTVAKSGEHFVFIIPVAEELDLKKAAAASKQKSIEMIAQKELLPLTGYVHGGCSPIGMKKTFVTFLDESAILCEQIVISAGKIGHQMKLVPDDILTLTGGAYAALTR